MCKQCYAVLQSGLAVLTCVATVLHVAGAAEHGTGSGAMTETHPAAGAEAEAAAGGQALFLNPCSA
jgi:hypothetical protein